MNGTNDYSGVVKSKFRYDFISDIFYGSVLVLNNQTFVKSSQATRTTLLSIGLSKDQLTW